MSLPRHGSPSSDGSAPWTGHRWQIEKALDNILRPLPKVIQPPLRKGRENERTFRKQRLKSTLYECAKRAHPKDLVLLMPGGRKRKPMSNAHLMAETGQGKPSVIAHFRYATDQLGLFKTITAHGWQGATRRQFVEEVVKAAYELESNRDRVARDLNLDPRSDLEGNQEYQLKVTRSTQIEPLTQGVSGSVSNEVPGDQALAMASQTREDAASESRSRGGSSKEQGEPARTLTLAELAQGDAPQCEVPLWIQNMRAAMVAKNTRSLSKVIALKRPGDPAWENVDLRYWIEAGGKA